jgi:8-oxoguanine deaminase
MTSLLIQNASLIATMDDQRRRIPDGAIYVENGFIREIGPTTALPQTADRVILADDMLILPGLINTHHHLYQTLTRAVPDAQDVQLFRWLKTLYPIWAGLTGEAVYVSALVGLAELMMSGCTTAVDHLYIFPNDVRLDDEIRAAQEIGIRFHATRGAMSRGESQGGLPPDEVVEDEAWILKDTRRVIETYHNPDPGAMTQIVVGPCSPFSVTESLMRASADLARSYGVRLHTHLAETADEEAYIEATSGKRPVDYARSLGWLGEDVWFAHGVHVNSEEIQTLAATQTGIAHCPSSNMRLASGIAPIREYVDHGVPVGLAVDGSASNDSSHMLAEARMAMLLQRVRGNPAGLSAEEALLLATRGGAALLGRSDIGQLAPNMAADIIGIRLDQLPYAGAALHDPVAATVFCTPMTVDLSIVNGDVVIEDGRLKTLDVEAAVARQNTIAQGLVRSV